MPTHQPFSYCPRLVSKTRAQVRAELLARGFDRLSKKLDQAIEAKTFKRLRRMP